MSKEIAIASLSVALLAFSVSILNSLELGKMRDMAARDIFLLEKQLNDTQDRLYSLQRMTESNFAQHWMLLGEEAKKTSGFTPMCFGITQDPCRIYVLAKENTNVTTVTNSTK